MEHVGSSWTRDQTHVPCIGRRLLIHCATREAFTWLSGSSQALSSWWQAGSAWEPRGATTARTSSWQGLHGHPLFPLILLRDSFSQHTNLGGHLIFITLLERSYSHPHLQMRKLRCRINIFCLISVSQRNRGSLHSSLLTRE